MQPHLKITNDDISPYVLLPGDPGRVDLIGKYLNDFKIVSCNREFKVGVGMYKSKKITVCSTGIGCPSTAIATEELITAGAKYLIRVGTCGGAWRRDIQAGSLVVPTATIRDEGTTQEYIPLGFPAVADISIVNSLIGAAQRLEVKTYTGINRTHDAFYGSNESIVKWGKYLSEKLWQTSDTPILSSEMEAAALFVIASLRNVCAGAVLAVNADPEPLCDRMRGLSQSVVTEKSENCTQATVDIMVRVALEALFDLP